MRASRLAAPPPPRAPHTLSDGLTRTRPRPPRASPPLPSPRRRSPPLSASVHAALALETSRGDFDFSPDGLLPRLAAARRDELLTDLTLLAGGRRFACHRLVLAAWSGYFRAMFSGRWREAKEVRLECEAEELECFLGFCYSGALRRLTPRVAAALAPLAAFLDVPPLEDVCAAVLLRHATPAELLRLLGGSSSARLRALCAAQLAHEAAELLPPASGEGAAEIGALPREAMRELRALPLEAMRELLAEAAACDPAASLRLALAWADGRGGAEGACEAVLPLVPLHAVGAAALRDLLAARPHLLHSAALQGLVHAACKQHSLTAFHKGLPLRRLPLRREPSECERRRSGGAAGGGEPPPLLPPRGGGDEAAAAAAVQAAARGVAARRRVAAVRREHTAASTTSPSSIPTAAMPTTTTSPSSIPTAAMPTTTTSPSSIPTAAMPTTTTSPSSIPTAAMPTTTTSSSSIPTAAMPTTTTSPSSIPTAAMPTTTTSSSSIPTAAIPTTTSPSSTPTATTPPASTTAAASISPAIPTTTSPSSAPTAGSLPASTTSAIPTASTRGGGVRSAREARAAAACVSLQAAWRGRRQRYRGSAADVVGLRGIRRELAAMVEDDVFARMLRQMQERAAVQLQAAARRRIARRLRQSLTPPPPPPAEEVWTCPLRLCHRRGCKCNAVNVERRRTLSSTKLPLQPPAA
ncbi:hypothetical protein AB1Y20_004917 [Prymnesium parvum]|uniref:BTB domain-containing protein n=1 Tax=Prymnesium parvum TaxID=97485 RepID=A0AB34IXY9_PRYPA